MVLFDNLFNNSAKEYYNNGVHLHNLGRISEALAAYDKAIAINPNEAHIWNSKGLAYSTLGRHTEAIECYDRALRIDPKFIDVLVNHGIALCNLGDYYNAIKDFDKVIAINPGFERARHNRKLVFEKAKKFEHDTEKALTSLADALCIHGRKTEDIQSIDKALATRPYDTEVWMTKGWLFSDLGRYSEALTFFDKAISLNENFVDAWIARGHMMSELTCYSAALASYDRAIAINPEYHEAWFGRGWVQYKQAWYKDSVKSLDKAIELNKDFGEAWRLRAYALNEAGTRICEARISYERAHALLNLREVPDDSQRWRSLPEPQLPQQPLPEPQEQVPPAQQPKSPAVIPMSDFPCQKLREIIAKYGSSVINDPKKVRGLLLDYCATSQTGTGSNYGKEIYMLINAMNQNIPQELLSSTVNEPPEFKQGRLKKRLTDLAVEETAARWAVESWAEALGVSSDNIR